MATDPYRYFRVEARELLDQLSQGALDLEKGVPADDVIGRLLRQAHTLKGAARVVKQSEIADCAHQLEGLFLTLRDSAERPPQDLIDRLLALVDQAGARLAQLIPAPEHEAPTAGRALPELTHLFRPDMADLEALVDGVAKVDQHLAALRPQLDQADRIRHLIELIDDHLARFRAAVPMAGGNRATFANVLSMIDELRGRFGGLERSATYEVDQIERELRQVSDAAARLRLVPARALFALLERTARDAARALGKRVIFTGHGGDVRVDSGILATVQTALLQVVRNAVAHGIESERARRDAGKPLEGQVTVTVTHRGTDISFVCSDDGHGVDFDAVGRILRQRGLLPPERQRMDADALLRLLLQGGISTSGTVTQLSGRGIGLDVVREAGDRLGGKVAMRTEAGQGTTLELVVPSSMLSFQALLVDADGVAAAVPLDSVRRSLRVAPDQIVHTASSESILQDGMSIPLVTLTGMINPTGHHRQIGRACSAFIVEAALGTAAIAVDRIVGTATVVMRPLPELAPALPCIAGASLDAHGDPRLVLDPVRLVAEAGRWTPRHGDAPIKRPSILVVDDSLTTRMLEQSILESAGYDVGVASSGEEGLEKARAGTFALFLVDVEMPGIDGFTFIQQVRADPALRDTPSILVTSRASTEDRERGLAVGAQEYIVKTDFDQHALLERIRSLVQ